MKCMANGQWTSTRVWGTADFSADMTMSNLWQNRGRRSRSYAAPSGTSHTPHQVDQRQDHLGHDRLPGICNPNRNGLSDKRNGEPVDREWKQWWVRDESTLINVAGLRYRRTRCSILGHEFEHYASVRGACYITFRNSGHPRRRACSVSQPFRRSISGSMNDQSTDCFGTVPCRVECEP